MTQIGQTISATDFQKAYPVGTKLSASDFNAKYQPQSQPTTDNPQLEEVAGSTTGATGAFKVAQGLGIAKAGMGLATAARVVGGSINQTGTDESQMFNSQQAVINQLQKLRTQGVPKTDLKYMQLENFLKRNQGNQAVTQAQIDPGTQLSNKEVLGSFGNAGVDILGAGSLSEEGALGGQAAKINKIVQPFSEVSKLGKTANSVIANGTLGYASDVANAANNNQNSIFKPGLGTAVGVALPVVSAVGGAILKRVTGLTTGAGKTVLQRALDNPNEVNTAINEYAKTPEAKQQLVDTAKESINNYLKDRSTQFGQGISNLKINNSEATSAISYIDKNGQKVFTKLTPEELNIAKNEVANIPKAGEGLSQIHLDPLNSKLTNGATEVSRADFIAGHPQVKEVFDALPKAGIPKQAVLDSFSNAVGKFGGQVKDGTLTFGDTALNSSEQKAVSDVYDVVKGWKDVTPQGMDTLRQRIGNEISNFKFANNGRDSVILGSVKQDLTNLMKDKISGYGDLLKNYGTQTQTAKDLASELSLKGTAKPSTQLGKVMKLFKKDPTVLENLTKVMGEKQANDFLNQISGAILSDWLPQSGALKRLGSEEGILGLGAVAHGGLAALPGALPAAVGAGAISSPKIVGKAAVGAGKLIKSGIGKGLIKTATIAASKIKPK